MGYIYKVVWNQTFGRFVVCSEFGKKSKSKTENVLASAILISSLLFSSVMADDMVFTFNPKDENNSFFDYHNWGIDPNDPIVSEYGLDTEYWNFNPNDEDFYPKYTFLIDGTHPIKMEWKESDAINYASIEIKKNAALDMILPIVDDDSEGVQVVLGNEGLNIDVEGNLTLTELGSCGLPCNNLRLNHVTIGNDLMDQPAKLNVNSNGVSTVQYYNSLAESGIDINTLIIGGQGTFGEVIVDNALLKVAHHQSNARYSEEFVLRVGGDQGEGRLEVINGGVLHLNTDRTTLWKSYETTYDLLSFNIIADQLATGRFVATVGENGGTGELLVSGINDNLDQRSVIESGQSISFGVGKDSKGSLIVEKGGVFRSYITKMESALNVFSDLYVYDLDHEEAHDLVAATATRLGVDGGYGHILVRDEGSSVEIGGYNNGGELPLDSIIYGEGAIGELTVGHSGTGELTLHNLGKVKIAHIHDATNDDYEPLGHQFSPGQSVDDNWEPLEGDVYGKTILATGANATGIINFTGDEYAGQSVKASDQLFTSGISVGRGQGVINLDHNATAEQPFIFDIKVSEDFNKIYHSDFNLNAVPTVVDVGQISFNHLDGVTLLKAHEFRGFDSDRAKDQTTFTYSGDTNIIGGELQVKDKNLLSQKSHFNIEQAGHLNIKNADQTIKSLHNDGLLSLGQTLTRSTEFNNVLTVNGDYSGAGKIMMNTSWNTPSDPANIMADNTSSTDQLHIKGNVKDGTKTEIAVYGGTILGDVKRSENQIENKIGIYSLPVVIVEGTAAPTSFIGEAKTSQDGHLAKIAHKANTSADTNVEINNFYWTLGVVMEQEGESPGEGGNPIVVLPEEGGKHVPILEEKIAVMTQMAKANHEQMTLGIGKYMERRAVSIGAPSWIRQYGQHSSLTGKNRFSYDANVWGVQMGYDLYHGETANGTQKIGVFTGYSQNNLKFKDQYRTESGSAMISADKRAGSGKTSMLSVGGYYTWLTDTNAYVDVVGMFSHIENKYQPNDYKEFRQRGYGISLSVEGGYPIAIVDTPWQIVPQGQLIYQHLNLKDKTVNDVQFQGVKDSTVLGRVGAQAMYTLDTNSYIYAGINMWHQFDKNKAINYGNSRFQEKYNQNWVELSVGADHRLSRNVSLFGDLSYQKNMGGKKREAYKGNIGLKISF